MTVEPMLRQNRVSVENTVGLRNKLEGSRQWHSVVVKLRLVASLSGACEGMGPRQLWVCETQWI